MDRRQFTVGLAALAGAAAVGSVSALADTRWKRTVSSQVSDAVAKTMKSVYFEFNDDGSRAIARDDLTRRIAAIEGIETFKVVCDERNNPPSLIDENGFGIDVHYKEYGKPALSIAARTSTFFVSGESLSTHRLNLQYAKGRSHG